MDREEKADGYEAVGAAMTAPHTPPLGARHGAQHCPEFL
jgi:hypothetical protein